MKINNTYLLKLQAIYPTFCIIAIGSTVFVALLDWLFTSLLNINEEVFGVWVPLIFPWIPIYIWLRPKTRSLKFKDQDKGSHFIQSISWLSTAILIITVLSTLKTSTGKLSHIPSVKINEIYKTRYLDIDNIHLDKSLTIAHSEFNNSGRYNEDFNINIYLACPFTDNQSITKAWLVEKYHYQIKNSLSKKVKYDKYKAFFERVSKKFFKSNFNHVEYFEILSPSDDFDAFTKAIEENSSEFKYLIKPMKGSYSDRSNGAMIGTILSFSIGSLILFIAISFPSYVPNKQARKRKGSDDLKNAMVYLIPKGSHYITSILININLIVFLIMIIYGLHPIHPSANDLLEWGGNRRQNVLDGEYWRLFTCMFIHSGFMHLGLNIFGLVIGSIFIESTIKRLDYILLYVITGIGASLNSIYWHTNSVGVGASGAIFGLFGLAIAFALTNIYDKGTKKFTLMLISIYVVLNLFLGLIGNTDTAGHLGGLCTGIIIGLLYTQLFKTRIIKS